MEKKYTLFKDGLRIWAIDGASQMIVEQSGE